MTVHFPPPVPNLQLRARARQELNRRRAEGGIRYFEPQPQQEPVLACTARGMLVLGGNRGGKTVVGAAEVVLRLLKLHPFKNTHAGPIKVWACSQDLPGVADQPHKQLEELKRWIPKDALRGGCWEKAYSPSARVLTLADGSTVVFKGYDQGLLKFESDAVHFVWMDEEPEDKRIWSSCLLRLADYDGGWMITATPVLSLQGKGWLEELWEKRTDSACGYETFVLSSFDNPHLSHAVLNDLFANLSEEERQVRAYGAFARLGGRVLQEFIPAPAPHGHLVPDQIPPRDWRHYLIFDPGWNTAGHLWAAVNNRGTIILYGEHYAKEEPIPVRMAVLHGMWQVFGKPEVEVIGDSAAFDNYRQGGTETVHPSDVDEYVAAAEKLGPECAAWFRPRKCIKADSYAYRVKRYLQARQLLVCEGLYHWRWEQERWTRQKERQGPTATERPTPDAPIKRFDHLMDCTRYLVNELPDPLPDPDSQIFNPYAEFWKRKLAPPKVGGYDGT